MMMMRMMTIMMMLKIMMMSIIMMMMMIMMMTRMIMMVMMITIMMMILMILMMTMMMTMLELSRQALLCRADGAPDGLPGRPQLRHLVRPHQLLARHQTRAQVAEAYQHDPSNYFVLLIITDGLITDFE